LKLFSIYALGEFDMTQRITEAHLRKVIRTELKEMMDQMGSEDQGPQFDAKTVGMGAAGAMIAATPYAIAEFLQEHPDMMQQVISMIQGAGEFVQSFGE
jgi:hypothetical protein